jgi:transposase-like protein
LNVSATKTKKKYVRKRSGTAKWHMSREAVNLPLADIYKMDELECWKFFVQARFGGKDTVRCPYCGSIGRHYFRLHDRRWKCHGCKSTFTVTTGTMFAQHKLSLRELLIGALTWVNSAAGQPALELKRHVDKSYNTAFTLQHKLREALMRGYNVGLLNGDIEMDGALQSGFNAADKRGVPRVDPTVKPGLSDKDIEEKSKKMTALAQANDRREKKKQASAAGTPLETGIAGRRSKDARLLIVVRKRSGIKGRGAVGSRVAIALTESDEIATSVVGDFVANHESYLNTDGGSGFAGQSAFFLGHNTVTHSKELVGPNGQNNNQAEELNFRYDRTEKGTHLNIEFKYMLDYAVETAFRSDTRWLANGDQLRIALNMALSVGVSKFWRGFTRGRHRTVEMLHPRPRVAPSSGPMKGRHPISSANGRPPR